MALDKGTNGKLTKLSVSSDGTTWDEICIFGDLTIDFGTETLNKEYCIGKKDPYVSTGNKEYPDVTYLTVWDEDATTAKGIGIIEAAAAADTITGKTIHIQIEMNNSTGAGKKGTLYVYEGVVSGYKVIAQESGIVKSEFTMAQTTTPVKTAAAV